MHFDRPKLFATISWESSQNMTVKQQLQDIVAHLPDDCSFDEVHHQLYVVEVLHNRSALADEGQFATQAEVEQRLSRWLAK